MSGSFVSIYVCSPIVEGIIVIVAQRLPTDTVNKETAAESLYVPYQAINWIMYGPGAMVESVEYVSN